MSKAFPNVWKNEDTNSELQSEVTCNGTPCFEKTWSTNNWASMGAVVVSTVRTNIDCLVSRSTMTRIVSCLEDGVLEPLRRLWCKVTLQSRLVLELQTIDSQAHIGKNRGSRLSKSEGSGHLLVQVFRQKKGMH